MKKIIYISILLLGGLTISNAQKTQVKRADKEYNNLNYIDAIETYEKVANKGYKSVDMLEKLGNSYYFNAEYVDAAKWYAELFVLQPETTDAEYYYRYSQSLKSTGDYKKAAEYMDKFYKVKGDDHRAKLFTTEKNYLAVIEANSGRFIIENAGDLNSELSDYGTTIYNGEVIFASTRKAGKIAPRTQGWNDQPFSALYSSKTNTEGKQQSASFFSDKLDSKFNEATPVFTKDGNTVYFTRNNYLKKRGFDNERITLLKVYRATLKDGKWTDVSELPFNSNDYNVAHPALSPDDKTLYFASNMPGTLGDADIWKVAINADGTFGTPTNLGSTVNTEGRESFPFVTSENELYYASTGKLGIGGMDVFVSKITGNSYDEAINVGKPINTPMDDFAFYFDPTTRTGFLSSNREGGKGYDDIYKFTELKKLICEHLLAGTVTDVETGKILADAKVSLFDQNNKLIATTVSDKNGKYSFGKEYVKCDTSYRVRAEKEKYSTEEKYIKTPKSTGETMVDIALKQTKVEIEEGMDLAKTLNIPIIYFDLDKSNIRPDAAIEIAKILQVMQDYPTMKIDIRSHTDCRQTYEYNMLLSDRRAKSTRHWLINKGISASRLTAKGYGETQLVNNCPCEPTNKSDCSEAEHQLNRRSEFIVVSK